MNLTRLRNLRGSGSQQFRLPPSDLLLIGLDGHGRRVVSGPARLSELQGCAQLGALTASRACVLSTVALVNSRGDIVMRRTVAPPVALSNADTFVPLLTA